MLILSGIYGCRNGTTNEVASENSLEDWAMTGFVKVDSLNPILQPSPELTFDCPLSGKTVNWEERNVLNPAAIVRNDTIFMLYRAQDRNGTSRIGIATSTDGLHFTKRPQPVFYPANDAMKKYEWHYQKDSVNVGSETYFDGVEDPRIVESEDGTYILTYTSYDGKTARLCIASSKDLQNWTKHGVMLNTDKYRDEWSKSGAIVSRLVGNKVVATKVDGKYWMYFGDTNLFMATSDDLISWDAAEDEEKKQLINVLAPRKGYFDSRLVEPGPYALLRNDGILLIYNASNAINFNDPELPKLTYAAGQALYDKDKPYKQIARTESYFIHPDKDYEKVGEVNEVCFVEGMVYYKNKWFLYYGTADSKIAVAVKTGAVENTAAK